ncbi:MAG: NAD(P)-dependent dehydrogenase (short-subunit alcohol dehydrogenase family) [Pseudohongiellaceae bacterium]|jgi:NAD(P)-dependent dehydrogenase (short-subunit alcohol dehydrogenase family)
MSYLVIGASSAIAKAVINQLTSEQQEVIQISRAFIAEQKSPLQFSLPDYSEASINNCLAEISANYDLKRLTRVIICTGILHQGEYLKPEKALSQLNEKNLLALLTINTITPLLWIKNLIYHFAKQQRCKILVLSARIGSITDNNIGGWISYRSSKAALNMALKTTGIEVARTHQNLKLIAYHPGTVDTPLSKPFSKNIPDNKLFSPELGAQYLLTVLNKAKHDQVVSYLDWNNQSIDW